MKEQNASRLLPQFEQLTPLVMLGLALSLLVAPVGAFRFSLLPVVLGFVLAGLPLVMAEQGMALRAKLAIVPGMQLLTRESDAPRYWRVLSWSSLGASIMASTLVAVVAGEKGTQVLQSLLGPEVHGGDMWPLVTLFVMLLGAMRAIRQVPLWIWLMPLGLVLVLRIAEVLSGHLQPVHSDLVRTVSLSPAGGLLVGVLMAGGGLAAHWSRFDHGDARGWLGRVVATLALVLMFWILQAGPTSLEALVLGFIVALLSLRALMEPFLAHARAKQWPPVVAPIVILIPMTILAEAVWALGGNDALPGLVRVLAAWVSVNLLLTALYSGWIMKISHLRKALAFPSEGIYNLWRVMVRWVAPITLVVAWWQVLRG